MLLLVTNLSAQKPGNSVKAQPKTQSEAKKGTDNQGFGVISGILHDGISGEKVEYASVVLFRTTDSSIVSGSISDTKGRFVLNNLAAGKYYLKIQFIGYENIVIPGLSVSAKLADIKLGDVTMQPKSSSLSGVVITSKKALVSNNLDKKVIAVDKNMALGGGTATDVVENVPSVAVDADGNITLRGNSNITLLVDGKPSSQAGLAASDILSQIPASAIESVEVITNPSVRYDPDGTSGIINIVLKKKALQGFNGMVSVNAGTRDKYNGSLNLNFRQEKFNIFAGFDGRMNRMSNTMQSTRTTSYSDFVNILRQSSSGFMNRNMYNISGGVDYFINTRSTLTLSVQSRKMMFDSDDKTLNGNYTAGDSLLRYFERKVQNNRHINSTDYTLSFKHLYPQKGREFTNDFIFSSNKMDNGSNINQQDYIAPNSGTTGSPLLQKNDAVNNNVLYTLQGNYIYPMESGARIEAGYKAAIRDMSMDYNYSTYDSATGKYESQASLKNQYDYTDQLYAIYAIYGNSWKKIKYQAGLRFEQVFTVSRVAQTNTDYNSKYSSFYPSLHTQYDLGKQRELQFSYSRRVERPSPREMNPYVDYTDSLNIETGNPALKPEFTNSLELGIMKYWDKSSLTSSIFYHSTKNVVEDISQLQGNGVTITKPENINNGSSYGLELVAAANPVKWYRLNATFSFYRELMSSIPALNIEGSDRYSWSTRLNMTIIPWKDGSIQLIGTYNSPTRSVQEYRKAQYYADASVRQEVWKNKLSFNLRLTDVFNTRTFSGNTYGNGFTTESLRHRESRVLYAGLQLKINNYNKKPAKELNNGDNQEQDGF